MEPSRIESESISDNRRQTNENINIPNYYLLPLVFDLSLELTEV